MAAVHAGVDFRTMLRSGQFSDLMLVCQGKEFKIHKVVACPQSPVLSAAVSGEFKVSREAHRPIFRTAEQALNLDAGEPDRRRPD